VVEDRASERGDGVPALLFRADVDFLAEPNEFLEIEVSWSAGAEFVDAATVR
jgi:hypothetical protein